MSWQSDIVLFPGPSYVLSRSFCSQHLQRLWQPDDDPTSVRGASWPGTCIWGIVRAQYIHLASGPVGHCVTTVVTKWGVYWRWVDMTNMVYISQEPPHHWGWLWWYKAMWGGDATVGLVLGNWPGQHRILSQTELDIVNWDFLNLKYYRRQHIVVCLFIFFSDFNLMHLSSHILNF